MRKSSLRAFRREAGRQGIQQQDVEIACVAQILAQ